MHKPIIEQLGLAGLAMILAFLVWVGATFEENPPTTQELSEAIPIELVGRPQGWIIRNQSAEFVHVEVRGREDSVKRLTLSSFRAIADLAGLAEGLHEVPVEVELSDKAVSILVQEPPTISLTLDRQEEKMLPVLIAVMDAESVPLGYTSRPPNSEPSEVKVVGPKMLVDQVAEARTTVWLRGSKTTVESRQTVRLVDASGNPVSELKPDPAIVTISVPVEQDLGFRDVTVRAVITGTPASGYWVSNILVQPTALTVFGLPSTLEKTGGFLETVPIDITGAKANLVKRVLPNLPSGISVLSEGAQQGIQVTVEISAIVGGQTMRKQVALQGLSLGLKATVSPEMVDVILSGPLPVLQDLTAEDVQVVVDLFGLSVGTHKVVPKVTLAPEGLQAVSIVPDAVEVSILLGP